MGTLQKNMIMMKFFNGLRQVFAAKAREKTEKEAVELATTRDVSTGGETRVFRLGDIRCSDISTDKITNDHIVNPAIWGRRDLL